MASQDPGLSAAEHALSRGDHAEARRRAQEVLAGGAAEEEKARCRAILDQLRSDRAVLFLLVACVVFFLVIVAATVAKG